MALTSGTKLGQYEILSPLGAGSMGEVYRARDPRLGREVAIKVLPELVFLEPQRLLRFEAEARAAAALNHPNILAVYQMGTYLGVPYMVTELLEGKTLTETIRRGPLPLRRAIDYAVQIAQGLAAAHEKGIVHRDLKPDNLFVTKDGRIKVLDFGLAKLIEPKESVTTQAPTITLPGVAMGTVGYMSPEQVRGLTIDHRSDIFALGAILYEMVMGKATFQKPTSADTISAILNEEPAPISQLAPDTPVGLERVVSRCLEKNAEQRFQSASDLAFALQALSDPATSSPTGAQEIRRDKDEGHGLRIAPAAIALLAVICAAVILHFWMQPAAVPKVANYVQLTHDGQQKSLIATDGARIYLDLGEGRAGSFASHGIAEMSVSGGEPRKLSLAPSPNMVPVDLSADSSELLVVDGQGAPPKGPLWSLPILGGSPRRLADAVGESAAWSPDGKSLVYTSLGEVFLAKADGTQSRKLLGVKGDILNVVWAPDGGHLRFDSSETAGTVGRQLVWEASADGTGLHRLLEGWREPPDECCGRWTADGKYFVFQSGGQIWALPKTPGFLHSESSPILLTSSPLTLSSPLPSKNGKKLFMIGQTYRGELTRYDSKSGQFAPFLGGISAEYVAFSQDGRWVSYVSYREGTLWRSKLDGSERLQLTYPPMYPVLPRWSPDGKEIVFFEFALSGDKPARIYEVSPDGGSPRQLLPDDHSQQLDPNWSPDGSKIIFAGESNDPTSAIHILEVTSRKISDLPGSQGLYSPRWSPDGRYISAFSADSKTLLLFDFQTQKWTDLATGSLSWLNWSHDGQYVYVLDFMGKNAVVKIRVSDHKIGQVVDLNNFVTTGRYGGCLALTPDDSLLLLRDTGSQDVYSVDWQAQ
ncbi:MAG TPA: protein kinase [Candidatus Sulfotelmatobacter sp.]|jgi:eukaryotic-like serine/threonine-protein kinase|nr:protein kinase [Candidatus Sulfotelmatobacter sp.]